MKKAILIIATIILLISICAVSVFAVHSETVQPYYTRFVSIETELNMSAAVARYEGSAYSDEPTDKVYVTAYLQQKVNGSWVSISNASANGSMQASAFGSHGVTSGSYYRIRVDAKAYDASGALIESATSYSSQKYY